MLYTPRSFFVVLLSFTLFSGVAVVDAHTGDVVESSWAYKPPAIDGVLSPGEWDDATMVQVTFYSVPDGGVFCTFSLYVMNDDFNLYLAAVWPDDTYSVDDAILILFDPQHDGVATDDDEDGIHVGLLETLEDVGYTPAPGLGEMFDGFYDTSRPISALLPFANDPAQHGRGMRTHDGSNWVLEARKPLRSGDPHDMYVGPCQTIGFGIFIMDIVTEWPDVAAGVWPEEGLAIFPEGENPRWEIAQEVAADLHLACYPVPVGGMMLPQSSNVSLNVVLALVILASLIVAFKLRTTFKAVT